MRQMRSAKGVRQVIYPALCRFVVKADHLEDLVHLGTLTRPAARFLEASVVAGLNILVAGGTQSGNPTTS
jgi:Flp pilus assembly CpaF family ATPase